MESLWSFGADVLGRWESVLPIYSSFWNSLYSMPISVILGGLLFSRSPFWGDLLLFCLEGGAWVPLPCASSCPFSNHYHGFSTILAVLWILLPSTLPHSIPSPAVTDASYLQLDIYHTIPWSLCCQPILLWSHGVFLPRHATPTIAHFLCGCCYHAATCLYIPPTCLATAPSDPTPPGFWMTWMYASCPFSFSFL